MKKFINEFKVFIMRGNVMDLAVGVIIGAAFQAIVNSLVKDIITPLISLITGGLDFSNLFIQLNGAEKFTTVADAQAAGVAVLAYGSFITAVINFLIMAFVIFCLVKGINTLSAKMIHTEEEASAAPTTKKCPYCQSEINIEATRCPHCTSEIQ
ncbi:MAG: large conductance mechanosensitive channel protein MscL [Schaedlerella sp.]|nr:large conductance mechanosensitive channel protein MscL [Schaedlerella sp.]